MEAGVWCQNVQVQDGANDTDPVPVPFSLSCMFLFLCPGSQLSLLAWPQATGSEILSGCYFMERDTLDSAYDLCYTGGEICTYMYVYLEPRQATWIFETHCPAGDKECRQVISKAAVGLVPGMQPCCVPCGPRLLLEMALGKLECGLAGATEVCWACVWQGQGRLIMYTQGGALLLHFTQAFIFEHSLIAVIHTYVAFLAG